MTSSRTVMVPLTAPESRALSATIAPSIRLHSPWTSEVHDRSPSTEPSTCKSAVASTLPLTVTSAPSTEKVEPLATGLAGFRGARLGELGSGFFENMGSSLQERPGIDRAAMDANFEMKMRAGRAAGIPNQADDFAGSHGLARLRAPRGHMGIAGHHPVAMRDLDHLSVTGLGAYESNLAVGRGMDRGADAALEVEPGMHRRAAVKRVAAITEAGRDHTHVSRHDLGYTAHPALQRLHARETEREALEARIERAVAAGRKLLERTTLRRARGGQDASRIEAKLAQRLLCPGRAPVRIARQPLDESELARLDTCQSGRLGHDRADLVDRFGRLAAAVGHQLVADDVVRQHRGGGFEKLHPAADFVRNLIDVIAIGGDSAFGGGDFGFPFEQGQASRLGAILAYRHHTHRQPPTADHRHDQAGRGNLHPGAYRDETDLALRAHEELALRKPTPQTVTQPANGYRFQVKPRLSRPKLWRGATR